MPSFDKDQVPLFAREGLFRQKLNQLRNTGNINERTTNEGSNRFRELESGIHLNNMQKSFLTAEPQEGERTTLLDNTTELYNRATIMRVIRDELKRAKRYKHAMSLLVVQIDGFEKMQKGNSQATVDSVLKGVANFLMNIVRDVDIPARYDVNTFLVVCPETDPKGVAVLAERVRSKIMLERVSDVGQNWHVTVSQGIAGYPGSSLKAEELIDTCIACAEAAGQNGGNQTVTAEA
ncbi:MAG: GGDEF domain-containing protein [Cyanobacteria bacterium REEB67]|nr:GGDEF domain-containing protein [Cyanobacteria bacterium REEB67]